MALIGEMKYLTIGDATYEIPSSGGSTSAGVTSLSTSAGTYSAVSGGTGAVTINIPTKTSDLTNDSDYITGMTILSYGSSTWNDFITAYNANKVVYCRASSQSNPATGSQTRLAFMAYVNNATSPTSVEFQYYRSVNGHSDSQQGDQVYVYTLTSGNSWSVTVRENYTKIVAGTGLNGSYSSGVLTLSSTIPTPRTSWRTNEHDLSVSKASGTTASTIANTNIEVPFDGLVSVAGHAQFANNSSRSRHAEIWYVPALDPTGVHIMNEATVLAATSANTKVALSAVYRVTAGSTIVLSVWQNSGSALNVGGHLDAIFFLEL